MILKSHLPQVLLLLTEEYNYKCYSKIEGKNIYINPITKQNTITIHYNERAKDSLMTLDSANVYEIIHKINERKNYKYLISYQTKEPITTPIWGEFPLSASIEDIIFVLCDQAEKCYTKQDNIITIFDCDKKTKQL
jgi:hypothetical protein